MVTTLYLVRHGKTEGSEAKRYKGSLDVPLSPAGIEQMRRSSNFILKHLLNSAPSRKNDYLKDIHGDSSTAEPDAPGLTAVYCSNLSRASVSAEIIAGKFGLKPIPIADLNERNFGVWEGMTFSEIKEKYPVEFKLWSEDPLRFSPPDGESTLKVRDRVIRALEGIINNHNGKDQNIAVVAHGGVNRIILCHFLGIPLENIFRIEQDNASVNIIELWSKYPVIKLINGLC
jgi:broad specificity phosphatase PhoE